MASGPTARAGLAAPVRITPDALNSVLVQDIMTRTVYRARPEETLLDATRTMRTHHLSGLPVVDVHDRVVGVLSEQDIVRELDVSVGLGRPRGLLDLILAEEIRGRERLPAVALAALRSRTVSAAMSKRPVTVDPDATLGEASRLLRQFGINRLPVTEEGRLVGIVTRQEVVSAVDVLQSGRPGTVVVRRFVAGATSRSKGPAPGRPRATHGHTSETLRDL